MSHKPDAERPILSIISRLTRKRRNAGGHNPPRGRQRTQEEIEWEMSAEDALRVLTTQHVTEVSGAAAFAPQGSAEFRPLRHRSAPAPDPLDPETPIEPPDSLRMPETHRPEASGHARAAQRILIAESRTELRKTLAALLTKLGLEVIEAADGRQALAILRTTPCAVAMIDTQLPDIPAEALVARLRKLPEGQNLPVVLTAQDDTRLDLSQNEWLNIHHYLLKPFTLFGLYRTLSEFCSLKQPERAVRHRGSVGVVVENDKTRWMLRRLLSRHGFHVAISGRPEQLEHWLMLEGNTPLDGWLVEVTTPALCDRVLEELDRLSDAPVITGLPLEPDPADTVPQGEWEKRLARRIADLITPRTSRSEGIRA
ncbi:response regulator [Hahella sp. SMD15-11]|uniref:Response regulator n=1 Tax=Thermohahella caldifontis TaxID=3142973 RepID=A0AB39UV32_9GAMM